jgi:hypothetical protein
MAWAHGGILRNASGTNDLRPNLIFLNRGDGHA